MRPDTLADLVEFSRWQMESYDVDPAYPVLREIIAEWGLSPTEALRFVWFYVAWYSLPSAVEAWLAIDGWHGQPVPMSLAKLPTGVERRGLRGGERLIAYLSHAWEFAPLTAPTSWGDVRAVVELAPGNGRWASYKTAEICQKVLGWPIVPTDAGHADSTGPRHGLALLYDDDPTGNSPAVIALLDARTDALTERLAPVGVSDVGLTETMLCDFNSLARGHYYVGHDWDLMLHHALGSNPVARSAILNARSRAVDHRWLGEFHDWRGVRAELRPLYRDTGRIGP